MAQSQSRAGKFIVQQPGAEGYSAFVPATLPPDPPVMLSDEAQVLLERASRSLGRLDGLARLLPDPGLFLYMYVRKEAVLSSQIEGTQSTLSDLLLFENEGIPSVPVDDVKEVSSYAAAMDHGLARLREGFPLSLRLVREIHAVLMKEGRGKDKTPGEFRTSQNWIGGSRPGNATFVPAPVHEMMPALDNWEKFLHTSPRSTPLLVRAGLVHAQFETIHPFLDGNGRVGRLLITFLLCAENALAQPLLYLSLYLKQHRDAYYAALQRVRTDGDWEGWLAFFFTGIDSVATQATETAQGLVELFEMDRRRIHEQFGRVGSALKVHDYLRRHAVGQSARIAKAAGVSLPTVFATLEKLQALGIVREATGQQRNRLFVYGKYIDILNAGVAEPVKP